MPRASLLFFLLLAAAQAFNLQPQSGRAPSATSADRQSIFDVELLRYTAESTRGNFMISPASVKAVLGMVLEGAKGTCADQLRKNLRLPADQRQAREVLAGALASLRHSSVEMANRIFLSHRYSVVRDYETIIGSYYNSQIESVNYGQPQAVADNINAWVSRATHGKIPTLVEAGNFDAGTVMVLANALFFNGTWKSAFDEKLTMNRCFYHDNACHQTSMMETQSFFDYGFISEMNAQAIELPYMGDKYSMLILMPNDRDGLTDSFIKDISYFSLNRIIKEMESTDVQLSMPKFVIDYSEDLVSTLQKLGIQEIFGKKADLTGIVQSEQSPQVDRIVHRTRLEVNEVGSIAAAASGAMVIPLIGTSTARMSIDHPFLFFIRDRTTGVILFEGRVTRPTQQTTRHTLPDSRFVNPQQPVYRAEPQQVRYDSQTYPTQQPVQVRSEQPQYTNQFAQWPQVNYQYQPQQYDSNPNNDKIYQTSG